MDYDYRSRTGQAYDSHSGMYNRQASSFYPKIGQPGQGTPHPPPSSRSSSFQTTPPPSSSSSGLGIRVSIKPEYRIKPPPQLAPVAVDIPRSTFQFDFEFERKILAEAEKDNQNWNRIVMESPSKTAESTHSSADSSVDPVVSKYIASGLSREAVILAVANYGDNPAKVREFVKSYNLLREMGFSSKNVAEVLAMYDNDTDKALAHFLNSSS